MADLFCVRSPYEMKEILCEKCSRLPFTKPAFWLLNFFWCSAEKSAEV